MPLAAQQWPTLEQAIIRAAAVYESGVVNGDPQT